MEAGWHRTSVSYFPWICQ